MYNAGSPGPDGPKNAKWLVKICQIASEICQTEAGRRLSVLNYPDMSKGKNAMLLWNQAWKHCM